MASIKTLKDKDNNIIYPQTHINAVYNSSGTTLNNILVPATTASLGLVKVDGTTITVGADGTLVANVGIKLNIVEELPSEGIAGIIYLLPNTGSTPNSYDEYIWVVPQSGLPYWEKIGTTDVDLSNYLSKTEAAATYLSQTDAATTYLSKTSAAATYYPANKITYGTVDLTPGVSELGDKEIYFYYEI